MWTLPTTKTRNHTRYQLNVHKIFHESAAIFGSLSKNGSPESVTIMPPPIWLPPSICSLKTTKFWVINIYVIYIIIEKTSWHDPTKRLILVCLTIRTLKIPIVDRIFLLPYSLNIHYSFWILPTLLYKPIYIYIHIHYQSLLHVDK